MTPPETKLLREKFTRMLDAQRCFLQVLPMKPSEEIFREAWQQCWTINEEIAQLFDLQCLTGPAIMKEASDAVKDIDELDALFSLEQTDPNA